MLSRRFMLVRIQSSLKSTTAGSDILYTGGTKPFKDMPGPKGRYAIPFIGPLFFMKPFGKYSSPALYQLLDSLHDKYGPTFCMELRGRSLITADPESIGTVFRNEGKYPSRGTIHMADHYAKKNNQQRGMAVLDGEEWHRLRSAAQKCMLRINSASVYLKPQISVSNDLVTRISTLSYTPQEFQEELFKYAAESIGVVCFNKRLGFLDPDNPPLSTDRLQYLEAMHQYFKLLLKDIGVPIYKIIPPRKYKDFERFANIAYRFGRVEVRDCLARVEKQIKDGSFDPEEPNLILQLKANPKTTPESVNVILLDLLVAGTDSTAKNMELLLLSLALNQDKQQKLYEEILDVVGPKGNEMETTHMPKMTYFRACMKESFRINFPTAVGGVRILPKDINVDGYLIPKGTTCILNLRRVCISSEYFESPNKYLPERWLRGDDTHRREKEYPSFSLLPFGFGTRNCLGRKFAEQEIWLGITKIVQNFHVAVTGKDKDYELRYTTFVQTKNPVTFTFTPR